MGGSLIAIQNYITESRYVVSNEKPNFVLNILSALAPHVDYQRAAKPTGLHHQISTRRYFSLTGLKYLLQTKEIAYNEFGLKYLCQTCQRKGL